jgi:hypothetical protein
MPSLPQTVPRSRKNHALDYRKLLNEPVNRFRFATLQPPRSQNKVFSLFVDASLPDSFFLNVSPIGNPKVLGASGICLMFFVARHRDGVPYSLAIRPLMSACTQKTEGDD